LETRHLTPGIMFLAAAYIGGMAAGKVSGAKLGAKLSGAPRSVYLYLPYCLFAQAGVAVGLTILASQNFPGEIGAKMVAVVTPSVFLLQLFAPFATRIALEKSGETGLNVTEKDLLEDVPVSELFQTSPPAVYENTPVSEILSMFSSGENLYYPVVSHEGKLLGIVSVEGIKSTLMEQELGGMLLAIDITEPAPPSIRENASLSEAGEAMKKRGTEFIPVEDNDGVLKGFIEERMLKKYISSRLLEMTSRITKLEKEKELRGKNR
jgi:CBS domain-containing protein